MSNVEKYRVSLKEIPESGLKFEENIPINYLRNFEGGIFEKPLFISCEIFSSRDEANAQGSVAFVIGFECCRCLKKFSLSINSPFHIKIKKRSFIKEDEDLNIEDEISFIDDEFISLIDIALEQVFLSLPMQPLCSEKCKGLCPQCGKNKNEGECTCINTTTDQRFAVLEKLKKDT